MRLFGARQTPQDLIQSGIYKPIALALYPDVFWPTSVALVALNLGAVEVPHGFTTAAAVRPSTPAAEATAVLELPGRKTLPNPEQEVQAAEEKQELMEGLAVGENTAHQKDRPGRSSARLEC